MSKLFPAIPDPQPTPESLAESVRSLKLGMELLTGQRPGAQPNCTFVQASAPTAISVGDRWVDDTGKERYWNGTSWLIPSPSISATAFQTLLDGISSTQGTILYRGASSWSALAPGTAGQVLQTGGSGANPSWVAQTSPYTPTWTEGVKTSADQSITSNITAQNATDLSFSAAANTYYAFEFVLMGTGSSGGFKVNMTFPTSPTAVYYAVVTGSGNSLTNQSSGTTTAGTDIGIFTSIPAAWVNAVIVVGFLSNGANAGTVQMKFAQQVSSAAATILKKGSWFRYRTV